jgi:predicted PurR-regulated permease PerM
MKKTLLRRIVFFTSVFIAIILVLIFIKGALFPIAISLFLAYLLDPVADFLESKKIPRTLAALLLLLVAGSLIFLAILVLVPILQKEFQKLIESIPQIVAAIEKNIFPLAEKYLGRKIPGTFQGIFNEAMKAAAGIDIEDVRPVAKMIAGAFSGLLGVFTALLASY